MNLYQLTSDYIAKKIPLVIITVTEKTGEGPVEVGKKMLVTKNNNLHGTVGGGALEYAAIEFCKDLFKTKKNVTKTYLLNNGKLVDNAISLPMTCGGKVTMLYEYIGPKEYIYIFGAGHCGQAVTKILKTMNYHVTVIDEREDVLANFQGADEIIHSPFAKYITDNELVEDGFVIASTPSHKYDFEVIDAIIEKKSTLQYFGMIASKKKLVNYLEHAYNKFGEDVDLSNFYSPIGLDLGGGSPEEIAISITSEIMAVSNKKPHHSHMRHTVKNKKYWME